MTKKKSEYADAVAEMEQILAFIESDGLSMDELSEKVKRVSVLLKSCKSKLFETEKEIEQIIQSMDDRPAR